MSLKQLLAVLALATAAAQAPAQTVPTAGTLVIVPAFGEVTRANDLATATLMVEEQDKDKAAAASRVNAKMREGMDILRKADPQAKLKTYGYYTYPVYPEDRQPQPLASVSRPRLPASWRVGQYVELKTTNLAALQKTVAAAQRVLALNGLTFGLTPETARALDEQRIAATYRNLNERIAFIAKAMGRPVTDAVLDTVDFEGSGNYARADMAAAAPAPMMYAKRAAEAQEVAEPSFEPGDTTLNMHLVGKVRFK